MKGVWRKFQIRKLRFTLWILTKSLESLFGAFYLFFIPYFAIVVVMLITVLPMTSILLNIYPDFPNSAGVFPFILLLLGLIPMIYSFTWAVGLYSLINMFGGIKPEKVQTQLAETQAKLKALTDA